MLPSHAGYRGALIGGLVVALVMAAIAILVGQVGGEARAFIEATIPITRFLCSGVMTASATTLALMLTLLGLSADTD